MAVTHNDILFDREIGQGENATISKDIANTNDTAFNQGSELDLRGTADQKIEDLPTYRRAKSIGQFN